MTDVLPGTVTTRPRLTWLRATLTAAWMETRTARTLVFDVPGWPGHVAGQHVDVKLTADDGYSAQRSYSIASAPEPGRLELTVQLVTGGEVSSYLVELMQVGDELELRGPIGGWFSWSPPGERALLLVAGGSGVVPLMAMLRSRVQTGERQPCRLVYSVRTPDHVFYAHELHQLSAFGDGLSVELVHTRSAPPDSPRAAGRLTGDDLRSQQQPTVPDATQVFVCGPTSFVESAAGLLVALGHPEQQIRTERFGPTGD